MTISEGAKIGLTEDHYKRAAEQLGVEIAVVKAVAAVESRGQGFITNPNDPHHGEPTILFERHIFHKLTEGRWTNRTEELQGAIYHPYRDISNPRPGGYGPPGGHQHDRLAKAVALDRDAALQSASWGRFQIMGFNFLNAGHYTLQSFINAMYRSEADHLEAFVAFIQSQGLMGFLQRLNWTGFARQYNGKAYYRNRYHTKLAAAYKRFKG